MDSVTSKGHGNHAQELDVGHTPRKDTLPPVATKRAKVSKACEAKSPSRALEMVFRAQMIDAAGEHSTVKSHAPDSYKQPVRVGTFSMPKPIKKRYDKHVDSGTLSDTCKTKRHVFPADSDTENVSLAKNKSVEKMATPTHRQITHKSLDPRVHLARARERASRMAGVIDVDTYDQRMEYRRKTASCEIHKDHKVEHANECRVSIDLTKADTVFPDLSGSEKIVGDHATESSAAAHERLPGAQSGSRSKSNKRVIGFGVAAHKFHANALPDCAGRKWLSGRCKSSNSKSTTSDNAESKDGMYAKPIGVCIDLTGEDGCRFGRTETSIKTDCTPSKGVSGKLAQVEHTGSLGMETSMVKVPAKATNAGQAGEYNSGVDLRVNNTPARSHSADRKHRAYVESTRKQSAPIYKSEPPRNHAENKGYARHRRPETGDTIAKRVHVLHKGTFKQDIHAIPWVRKVLAEPMLLPGTHKAVALAHAPTRHDRIRYKGRCLVWIPERLYSDAPDTYQDFRPRWVSRPEVYPTYEQYESPCLPDSVLADRVKELGRTLPPGSKAYHIARARLESAEASDASTSGGPYLTHGVHFEHTQGKDGFFSAQHITDLYQFPRRQRRNGVNRENHMLADRVEDLARRYTCEKDLHVNVRKRRTGRLQEKVATSALHDSIARLPKRAEERTADNILGDSTTGKRKYSAKHKMISRWIGSRTNKRRRRTQSHSNDDAAGQGKLKLRTTAHVTSADANNAGENGERRIPENTLSDPSSASVESQQNSGSDTDESARRREAAIHESTLRKLKQCCLRKRGKRTVSTDQSGTSERTDTSDMVIEFNLPQTRKLENPGLSRSGTVVETSTSAEQRFNENAHPLSQSPHPSQSPISELSLSDFSPLSSSSSSECSSSCASACSSKSCTCSECVRSARSSCSPSRADAIEARAGNDNRKTSNSKHVDVHAQNYSRSKNSTAPSTALPPKATADAPHPCLEAELHANIPLSPQTPSRPESEQLPPLLGPESNAVVQRMGQTPVYTCPWLVGQPCDGLTGSDLRGKPGVRQKEYLSRCSSRSSLSVCVADIVPSNTAVTEANRSNVNECAPHNIGQVEGLACQQQIRPADSAIENTTGANAEPLRDLQSANITFTPAFLAPVLDNPGLHNNTTGLGPQLHTQAVDTRSNTYTQRVVDLESPKFPMPEASLLDMIEMDWSATDYLDAIDARSQCLSRAEDTAFPDSAIAAPLPADVNLEKS